jgi:hypothetical protein
MEVAYSFLARAGEFTRDGTFSAIGADFSVVHSKVFPMPLTAMTLIAKLVFAEDEWGKHHDLRIELVGEDNVNLAPELKTDIDVPVPHDPEKKMAMRVAVGLLNIQFPHPGKYRVRLLLDGEETRSIKLEAVQLQNGEPQTFTGPEG